MIDFAWSYLATPGASLIAGLFGLAYLIYSGKCRGHKVNLPRGRFANAVMLSALFYTLIVLVVGQFFFGHAVSTTINQGFGDTRVAWLLVVLAVDVGNRVIDIFEE